MKEKYYLPYCIFFIISAVLLVIGFSLSTPREIFKGIYDIIFQSDILITDYIAVGGLGAAFVNCSIVSILSILILIINKVKPNGLIIAALWAIFGFSFLGKNIFNFWPIILGVWLYSRYKNEPFSNYILIALFGSTLSPTVSIFYFSEGATLLQGIFLGIVMGTFVGFILSPITLYCSQIHKGYCLYNTGFAAGLIASGLMSIFRAFGIEFEKKYLVSSGNNSFLSIILFTIFISLFILGYRKNGRSFKNFNEMLNEPGTLVSDFYIKYGIGISFINISILGTIFTSYVLMVGGELNGPAIAGIFTVAGFGACGKHIKNVTPVFIGSIFSSFLNIWPINSNEMILSTLFSTTLAPIAGKFGIGWGVIAGLLHVSIVMNIGYLHGGLNLYNNGFAGGIVVILLLPIIISLSEEEQPTL